LRPLRAHIWGPLECGETSSTRIIGPVWLGNGHAKRAFPLLVGPGVVWDAPASSAREADPAAAVEWATIRPSVRASRVAVRPVARRRRLAKRLFDVAFATFGLMVTAPLFPLVMAAIWLEDGRPFFFGHLREKRGGAEFPCWKFRSMYRDAEKRRQELAAQNQADGPQFYISDDPRVTRVGRILRRLNIDELPQFWNVLRGDMSVVGPRPSPRAENQYYPPWRDARLSVQPGITGLWQVCRSRQRGNDFQEWIKDDLEYVRKNSMLYDLVIIWRSIGLCIRGERRSS
jgi:lipopolysaccharide/colanic/teichoic acid biosynthesis glycosyltransferase